MSLHHRFIRTGLVLAANFLAAWCVGVGLGDMESIYDAARSAWSGGEKVTLQEAASVPYASIGVQIGSSTEIMLILASDSAGQQLWTSGARIAITTDHGRIVRSSGFQHDLGGLEPRRLANEDANRTRHWQADFPDLGLFSVLIACKENTVGDETIVILGKDIRTRRIEETCETQGPFDWSFKNVYWRDPASGLVWRSIQHVHPRLDAITTEILRPPK